MREIIFLYFRCYAVEKSTLSLLHSIYRATADILHPCIFYTHADDDIETGEASASKFSIQRPTARS